jgi:hypothetical protein
MRRYGWEDFALPLILVSAVTFTLTLRQQVDLPAPITPALAATAIQPDYMITVTAKRVPRECRTTAARTPECVSVLAGDTRMEMRENTTRLADNYAF